jgi:uncharacterized repeat protein (TIGR03803 family)
LLLKDRHFTHQPESANSQCVKSPDSVSHPLKSAARLIQWRGWWLITVFQGIAGLKFEDLNEIAYGSVLKLEVVTMLRRGHLYLARILLVVCLPLSLLISYSRGAATEKVLYTFQGGTDGSVPVAGLIFDQAGNLYGTTASGGANNAGTVFELTRSGTRWTKSILYSFTGDADGGSPLAPVIFDGAGHLYGTASQGGAVSTYGSGVAFELSPNSGVWTETVIHNFTGYSTNDGAFPTAGLVFDSAGSLWGTAAGNYVTLGIAFKLSRFSGSWTESIVEVGMNPLAGLVLDKGGQPFGTTELVFNGFGTVYELVSTQAGWTSTTLYGFTGGSDGADPGYGSLVLDDAGNLYGTTQAGGAYGYGVVFKVSSAPGHKETVLHSFAGGADGAYPQAALILDASGDLYGTTEQGGTSGYGTVFKLTRASGGQWSESVLHSFAGGRDGANPIAGLVKDDQGRLYGTTQYGGSPNAGVVYVIQP